MERHGTMAVERPLSSWGTRPGAARYHEELSEMWDFDKPLQSPGNREMLMVKEAESFPWKIIKSSWGNHEVIIEIALLAACRCKPCFSSKRHSEAAEFTSMLSQCVEVLPTKKNWSILSIHYLTLTTDFTQFFSYLFREKHHSSATEITVYSKHLSCLRLTLTLQIRLQSLSRPPNGRSNGRSEMSPETWAPGHDEQTDRNKKRGMYIVWKSC